MLSGLGYVALALTLTPVGGIVNVTERYATASVTFLLAGYMPKYCELEATQRWSAICCV